MPLSLYGTVTIELITSTYDAGLYGYENAEEVLMEYLTQKLLYSEEVEFKICSCQLISGPEHGENGDWETEFEINYELPRLKYTQ